MNSELKILITGSNGQLGFDCIRELKKRGYKNLLETTKNSLDITKEDEVNELLESYRPDVILHTAAFTDVNLAEKLPDLAYSVNFYGTKYLAEACKNIGAKMIYISSDYVFDGKGYDPFEISSKKDPLSVYGKSKSDGEDIIVETLDKFFIIRTSWLFGINGNNFVKKMLSNPNNTLDIVCDQVGSVTYTKDLAELICDMIETDKYGIYHATNDGFVSWAEFATEIFKKANIKKTVNYVTTAQQHLTDSNIANRPLNSRLSKKSLDMNGFKRLPFWKDALNRYLKELEENNE